jgi:NAD(P)-dependent dehydrogenase (short-subunit alcohol dehydrogenase family)
MKLDSSVTAIITGGASGLGAATARRLAEKGVKIGVFDLERQQEKAEALFKEIGGGVFCACAPATRPAPPAATARPARSRVSRPSSST